MCDAIIVSLISRMLHAVAAFRLKVADSFLKTSQCTLKKTRV